MNEYTLKLYDDTVDIIKAERYLNRTFDEYFTEDRKRETITNKANCLLKFIIFNRLFDNKKVLRASEEWCERQSIPNYRRTKVYHSALEEQLNREISQLKEKVKELEKEQTALKNCCSCQFSRAGEEWYCRKNEMCLSNPQIKNSCREWKAKGDKK